MKPDQPLRICETCPWLTKNHGKKHTSAWYREHPTIKGWYSKANLRRLWAGLRTGAAPGILCHSTDPDSKDYGGKGTIKPGKERACAGALNLIYANVNAFAKNQPQPFQPQMTKHAIADYVWRRITGQLPVVEDRQADVSLPW